MPLISPAVVAVQVWFGPPWQVQMMIGSPSFPCPPESSRHMPPIVRISPFDCQVNFWFVFPVHPQMITCVPGAVLDPVTSMHMFDASFVRSAVDVPLPAAL